MNFYNLYQINVVRIVREYTSILYKFGITNIHSFCYTCLNFIRYQFEKKIISNILWDEGSKVFPLSISIRIDCYGIGRHLLEKKIHWKSKENTCKFGMH
jgi:hypothetical protein